MSRHSASSPCLPETRDTREQAIDLHFDIRNALFLLGEPWQILDHLRQAEPLAEALGDQRRLGRIAMYSASCFRQMGDHDRALAAGQHALALAEALGDFDLRGHGAAYPWRALTFMGDFRRAIVLFRWKVAEHLPGELLQECFGTMGPPAVTSRVNLTRCLTELGAFAEGIASGEEAIRIAEAVNHPYSLIYAYDRVGALYLQKGALPQALHTLERGLALCGAENLPVLCPSPMQNKAPPMPRAGGSPRPCHDCNRQWSRLPPGAGWARVDSTC